jgi:O-antigen ligase
LQSAQELRVASQVNAPVVKASGELSNTERGSLMFLASAFLFRISLALVTFEQIRPFFDVQLSDYCVFTSLILFLFAPKDRLFGRAGSIFPLGGMLILVGCLLSLVNASSFHDTIAPFIRLFMLFALFAPLAIFHSKDVRKNMLFLLFGIFINSVVTLLQASIFPGIADVLSINPTRPDISDIGRFQGLTSHPNIIGLSAALGVLIGIGLFSFDDNKRIRGKVLVSVVVCAFAALLSGSRTVFVCLIPALLVLLLFQNRKRKAAVRILVVVALVSGVIAYFAPGVVEQFSKRIDSSGLEVDSDYGRLWSAVYAVVEISQKPILGWGIDHLDDAGLVEVPWTGELVGVHNTFLKFWHGAGLLGAIGFILLFASPVRQIRAILKQPLPEQTHNYLRLSLACYVLLFIVSNLGPFDYNRFLYMPLFILAGFASEVRAAATKRSVRLAQEKKLTLGSQPPVIA